MVQVQTAFSGFSVNDLTAAKKFYTETMGLKLADETMGLRLNLPAGGQIFIYPKDDHQPASFTILNFIVNNIDEVVDELTSQGVSFEHYENGPKTDEKGIMRGSSAGMGPDIAWFKDPAGNILSVIEDNAK